MNYYEKSLELHEKLKGKLEVVSKIKLKTKDDLSIAYTPGVAEPCREIAKDKENVYKYTMKGNAVAIISDGSAVLGLGNIGGEAAIPVMDGKAILFKEFANIDAVPICLSTQDIESTIATVKNISPIFGGINLEDIKAPECFEIEARLQDIGIPVMHDDQHGTAVVVLSGMINALKVVNKKFEEVKIVLNGPGAAGTAITKLLLLYGVKPENIVLCDRDGAIYEGRESLTGHKEELAKITNLNKEKGSLAEVINGKDVFIGVSSKNILSDIMIKSMNDPIIFAMANPDPEILPDLAKEAGAKVVATGRSDFPNQINNVLAFPGIFRGALDSRATKITERMKIAAAEALASIITNPTSEEIIPYALDKSVVPVVAKAVSDEWNNNS